MIGMSSTSCARRSVAAGMRSHRHLVRTGTRSRMTPSMTNGADRCYSISFPQNGFLADDSGTSTASSNTTPRRQGNSEQMARNKRRQPMDTTSSSSRTHQPPNVVPATSSRVRQHVKSNSPRRIDLVQSTMLMSKMMERREALPPPPSFWLSATSLDDRLYEDESVTEQRSALLRDTLVIMTNVRKSIQDGQIQVNGKTIHEVSALLGNALIIYSESPPAPLQERDDETIKRKTTTSPYESCMSLIQYMYELNVDIQPVNYSSAIRAACHQAQWKTASDLFLSQIDPDAGLVPVQPSLGWDQPIEMGLYAIARLAQQQHQPPNGSIHEKNTIDDIESQFSLAAEHVFDAAISMSMVSPQSEEAYILAAGSALGRAGEYRGCIEFLNSSYHSSRLGQSLVASVMNACVMNGQYKEASDVYTKCLKGPLASGSEWQWGGGYHTIHPVVRDLALVAMGHTKQEGNSQPAVDLLQQSISDEVPVTMEAIRGVLLACEMDNEWKKAGDILENILLPINNVKPFTIARDITVIMERANNITLSHTDVQQHDYEITGRGPLVDEHMLASVMRTCAASREFGMGMLYSRLYHHAKGTELTHVSIESENLLAATMVSLCGLHCFRDAAELYNTTRSNIMASDDTNMNETSDVSECYQFIQFVLEKPNDEQNHAWIRAQRLVDKTILLMKEPTHIAADSQLELIAKMVRCCTFAEQPGTGYHLARKFAATQLYRQEGESESVAAKLKSYFGLGANIESHENTNHSIESILASTDSLLSATMHAHRKMNQNQEALDHFFWKMDEVHNLTVGPASGTSLWSQSTNEALLALIEEDRLDEAEHIFDGMNDLARTPDTFLLMANSLYEQKQWKQMIDLYQVAVKAGCLTEEHAMKTLAAIVQWKEHNGSIKMRLIRAVIKDISQLMGVLPNEWLISNYWKVKRAVNNHYIRLLLNLEYSDNLQEIELRISLKQFDEAKELGLAAKNDVLRCMVRNAGSRQRNGNFDGNPVPDARENREREAQTKDRFDAIDIVGEAVLAARCTSFWNDLVFIDTVAIAFRSLKGNTECIEFVRDIIASGIQPNPRSLEQAHLAAKDLGDREAFEEFKFLLEEVSPR